ncbi:Gfo/Idh/MocA family protein [Methylophaga sp. OBS4]|uniref:Gfo/Idh/MocA family protein n=1 Tax=Methylophaga sp. OBS4 TaxID=2991935 RepID=UPI002253C64E|nr:Gfo/Idh/MocA family oxidoreductase [Methylophaga sp. OBS4]MCX4187970.1 Gfo/Idh/MocA family oxidoreductase [Methylophaga sp. OBS4]
MTTLRAAVIGVGYLGRFHAQKYAALSGVDLVAVVDIDAQRAQQVATEVGTAAYDDYRQILDKADVVSIAVPTQFHYDVARDFLSAGCHILLEKPITQTVEEADELIAIATEKKLVFQAGHLERFNPAIMALKGVLNNPVFIESHRLAPFKPRGTDVNVVLDLMIHDIDILLTLVPSTVKMINSVGVPVLSQEVDIANARLQFENGCVANVTASRVSRETMRKIRIFQPDAYISIDYQACKISILRKGGNGLPIPGLPETSMEERIFEQVDVLLEEIRSFLDAVRKGTPPLVSGEEGKRALGLALRINRKLA